MAKKTKVEKPVRAMTKRQLSHHRRELKRQRIFRNVGIAIVAVVVILVAVGWYLNEYRPANATVLKVNETEFSADYFVDVLRDYYVAQPQTPMEDLVPGVIQDLARNEIIRQGALALGLQVNEDEIRETIETAGLDAGDIGEGGRGQVGYQLLGSKLFEQYFLPQVAESQPQVHINAMLLETEAEALEIRQQLVSSDNFSGLAAEHSLDAYSKANGGNIGWHPETVLTQLLGSSVPGDYAASSEVGTLSQPRYDSGKTKPSGYWLLRVLEREFADEAQMQGLLLGTEAQAAEVRARLEAGENVTALAAEYSQLVESQKQGGELGIVTKGELTAVVDEWVFRPDIEIGEWSQPLRDDTVYTTGAWWLVEVLEKADERLLSQDDRDRLAENLFEAWLQVVLSDANNSIEDLLNPDMQAWVTEKVLRS